MEKEFTHCRLFWKTVLTPSTPIQPDSVPMTSLVNKEFKPKKDSDSFSLKLNNPSTDDFVSFVYLLSHSHVNNSKGRVV
jgi:hypothetical protein